MMLESLSRRLFAPRQRRDAAAEQVQLDHYIVHEKIGEGGMASVYRASHARLKRPTAIKVLDAQRAGENGDARFAREVIAASRLGSHPNSVTVYEYGHTTSGAQYCAMELVDGETLLQLVEREGPLSAARTIPILQQLASALGEAHAAGLIHRDVKPENIMLTTRGRQRDFVKVLDFGLVKDVATYNQLTKLTGRRSIAGTPHYMAPEAILDPENVGAAADVYALGCVAYFLLAGRPPFEGSNLIEICAGHVHQSAMPLSGAPGVEQVVLSCLEKNPSARPTMAMLAENLLHAA